MTTRVGIVGAGVGGLATAARLASRGYSVEVFEKLGRCGGRNHLLQDQGFQFDMGPSFVLMPDFFEEVFSYCGRDLKSFLDIKTLDTSYKIFYPDGDSLTVWRDAQKTKEELEKLERNSSAAYERLLRQTAEIYRLVKPLLYRCFTPGHALHPGYWPLLGKIKALESYWQLVKRFFKTDKLCYAFTFEAMFIGVSPFMAPAFYSVITYADHVQKIAHPMGGMYQIPLALEKLGRQLGVKFHYSAEVRRVGKSNGNLFLGLEADRKEFDQVVVNADYAYAQRALLNRPLPTYDYSCSTYLLYLGLKRKVPGLAHHNLFFSGDLKKNLTQIFTDKSMPQDPSFYVHVPTVTDASLAPPGKEIVYILIPVPNLDGSKDEIAGHRQRLRKIVFDKVNRIAGIDLDGLIEVEHAFYPRDFIDRYNIQYGATFGLGHTLMQSAFFRPANRDRRIKNLYFVGASTQPGGGLPPVIASSRIVADMICSRVV
ncbi:MAG TPA: phytoene desaturase family protein [Patescibacteria group bacterium]|nr:phytoene desaturase family protein [Patescibacteria group bacterium]